MDTCRQSEWSWKWIPSWYKTWSKPSIWLHRVLSISMESLAKAFFKMLLNILSYMFLYCFCCTPLWDSMLTNSHLQDISKLLLCTAEILLLKPLAAKSPHTCMASGKMILILRESEKLIHIYVSSHAINSMRQRSMPVDGKLDLALMR